MATANCSTCGGGINTESSPTGKCVRCLEAEARQIPLAVTAPKAAPPPAPPPEPVGAVPAAPLSVEREKTLGDDVAAGLAAEHLKAAADKGEHHGHAHKAHGKQK